MEEYNPHVDITNKEGRKAFTQLINFEDEMLAKPFSELSYDELLIVKKILLRRKKDVEDYKDALAGLAGQKTHERHEAVTEAVMQDFYYMEREFDKVNPDPTDLEIVEGLIKKVEDTKQA